MLSGTGLSTFNKEAAETALREHPDIKLVDTKQVEVKPISWVLATHANGQWPDLIDIDVESYEYEILKNCDWTKAGPKVLLIERPEANLRLLLTKWGYFLYLISGENSFYVRNEFKSELYKE